MATIGVSCPYVAKYTDNGDGTTAYTQGTRFAKAMELTAAIQSSKDNNLYADNGVAESDKSFSSGTLTVGVDDISDEASKLILGVVERKITVGGKEITALAYGDNTAAPYLGFGCIIKKKKDGVDKYRAVIFPKVMFGIPEDAATTQGENIEWKTPTLEAVIMRDDTENHEWKVEATLATETEAVAFIKAILGEAGANPAPDLVDPPQEPVV